MNNINLQKFARVLGAADEQERYSQLTTFGSSPVTLDPGVNDMTDIPPLSDAVSRTIYRDMAGYLNGDILVKLDRATMAASLEARCPFLDDNVVEFAWRLPTAVKIHDGLGKQPLRRLLRRYLPESLFNRPKHGFNVPIGEWLTGPLRGWAEDLLDEARIRSEGLLDSARIQACWQQHLTGKRDRSGELWAILMVQAWLDSTRSSKLSRPWSVISESGAETQAFPWPARVPVSGPTVSPVPNEIARSHAAPHPARNWNSGASAAVEPRGQR